MSDRPASPDAAKAEARRLLSEVLAQARVKSDAHKELRRKKRELNRLKEKWARFGVQLIEEDDNQQSPGGQSDHRDAGEAREG